MILGKGISEITESVCWAGSGQDGTAQGQLYGLHPGAHKAASVPVHLSLLSPHIEE